MTRPLVALAAERPGLDQALEQLGRTLQLPISRDDADKAELLLVLTSERLQLLDRRAPRQGPVYVDFVSGSSDHRRRFGGGRGQPLARAIGLKKGFNPLVLDATAGLGRDAFVLASLGCEIIMLERAPVVAALLQNGLERALTDPQTRSIASRMLLHCGDTVDFLTNLDPSERPDVIYLDPMYPARRKSALVKKEMRLLQRLLGEESDSAALLSTARRYAGQRVVVKRPAGAEWVGGESPTMVIESPNTRYDVYVSRSIK